MIDGNLVIEAGRWFVYVGIPVVLIGATWAALYWHRQESLRERRRDG